MSNPVLVEVTRGNLVESRHRGMMSVIFSAGSPKKCSAPCCSRIRSSRWIEPTEALEMKPN